MNIINERFKNIVLFKDLNVGDVFHIDGVYYIRTKLFITDCSTCWNCLSLENYDLYSFQDDQAVTKVEADLHIK